jgi:CubicO group peptidase (beta-lactamase class C family)
MARFFPELADSAFGSQVTVHHLLSHTSGIGEYWTDEYEKHWKEITTLDQMLPWVLKAGVKFTAGSQCAYSNSNFVLAGIIVGRVSGMDYYDYVRTNLYRPLGMTMTDSYSHKSTEVPLAVPLVKGPEGWRVAAQGFRGTSAGGGYSTARDVLKYIRGLLGGKVVQPQTLSLLTTSKTAGLEGGLDYGYGFILSGKGNARSWGHGGIAPGVNFELRYFPEGDFTVVLFCNQDNGAFDDLRKNTIRLITGER